MAKSVPKQHKWFFRRLRDVLKQRFNSSQLDRITLLVSLRLGTVIDGFHLPPEEPIPDSSASEGAKELCQKIATVSMVRDYEELCRYIDSSTSEEERTQIRHRFWATYQHQASKTLWPLLCHYFGRKEASVLMGRAEDELHDRLFSESPFSKTAQAYDPSKLGTFNEFFSRKILYRALDVVRREPNPPGTESDASNDLESVPFRQGPDEVDEKIPAALESCLSELEAQGVALKGGPGLEQRAVFELRYTAHRPPNDIGKGTLALLALMPGAMEKVKQEFEEVLRKACERLDDLQERFIERNESFNFLLRRQFLLEQYAPTSYPEIEQLKEEALARNLGELETEKQCLGLGPSDTKRCCHLDFMIAYHRYQRAVRQLEGARRKHRDCSEFRLPFVRSEEAIGSLLNIQQHRVHYSLVAARAFLRSCLEEKLGSRTEGDLD